MIKVTKKMLNVSRNNSKAFTIVELLIVIVIIGILAAITIVSYTGITKRASESSVQAELSNASKKIAIYYTLNGTYPTNIDQSTGCPTAPTPDNNNCIKFSSDTVFSYNFKTASTYGLSATKGSAAYQITESTGPVAFAPSFVKTWSSADIYGNNYGKDLVQTSDGGYAVTGNLDRPGAGSMDVFLAKYDAKGNLEWNKLWGGTGDDEGLGLIQTSNGSYVVTGYETSYGAGSGDMFIAKYDASGNLIWTKTLGGATNDCGKSITRTSDGGYAVTGYLAGRVFLAKYDASDSLNWNKSWGGGAEEGQDLIQTSDGGYAVAGKTGNSSYGAGGVDAILVKFDTNGNLGWNKSWGGTGADIGSGLVQTSDGGYAMTGYTDSYGAGGSDAFLAKYDASGNLSWSRTWGGASGDSGNKVIQTNDNGYSITGYTASYGAGNRDMFLAKFNNSGSLSWSKTFGGVDDDYGNRLVQTSDGGYAVGGYMTKSGHPQVLMAKYSASGNMNNCSSPMCQSPTATATTPTATVTTPSVTVTIPTVTVTTPTVTITPLTGTVTTVVAP